MQELGTAKADANQLQSSLFEKDSSLQRAAAQVLLLASLRKRGILSGWGARQDTCLLVTQLNIRAPQAEALHYDKRSLDKLLQHRQAELDGMHARLQAALVRGTTCTMPLSKCTSRELPCWQD